MGIYPSSGDQIITEDSPLGADFLARLQRDSEAATAPASAAGIRVVSLRIPAVLGGANLERSLGRVGDGRTWISWVALDELAAIVEHVLVTDALHGPVNPTSPSPVRNAEFAETLSRVRGSRFSLPMPAFALRLLFGEMAEALILASRRIQPARLLESGYEFRFPQLEMALRHELGKLGQG